MKKLVVLVLMMFLIMNLLSCNNHMPEIKETIEGNMKTYFEMSDGTWKCEDYIYEYRLEITGRMHAASKDSTFVFLSNSENITFEQAWKAAGFSSLLDDYFDIQEAVLVELY